MEAVTAFQLTTDDVGRLDYTIALTQAYYSYLNEQAVRVQHMKGSTAQTGSNASKRMCTS